VRSRGRCALSVHYRQKLNFTFEGLEAATAALGRIDEMRFRLQHAVEADREPSTVAASARRLGEEVAAALADDLNASAALAAVFRLVKEVNVAIEGGRLGHGDRQRVLDALAAVDTVFGVFDAAAWREVEEPTGTADEEVTRLVEERREAREARDFQRADALRDRLLAQGIVLEDTPAGTRWKRL
jgi:cysteinyl-tRNA synthetase